MAFHVIVGELAEFDASNFGVRQNAFAGFDGINALSKLPPCLHGFLTRIGKRHIAGFGTPKPISLCLPFN